MFVDSEDISKNKIPILKKQNPFNENSNKLKSNNNNYILIEEEDIKNNMNGNDNDNDKIIINPESETKINNPNNINIKKSTNFIIENPNVINMNNFKFSKEKLILDNPLNFSIIKEPHDLRNTLSPQEKLQKFKSLITHNQRKDFFGRLTLNYLQKSKVDINNEELITLLKLGNQNNYQKLLNESLKLNLTEDYKIDESILFRNWVKKFIKDKSNNNEENPLMISNFKSNPFFYKQPESDLFYYNRPSTKKPYETPSFRNKRDTSKDIIMPKDVNQAYNLLRKSKKNNNELLREFKDDPEKF